MACNKKDCRALPALPARCSAVGAPLASDALPAASALSSGGGVLLCRHLHVTSHSPMEVARSDQLHKALLAVLHFLGHAPDAWPADAFVGRRSPMDPALARAAVNLLHGSSGDLQV